MLLFILQVIVTKLVTNVFLIKHLLKANFPSYKSRFFVRPLYNLPHVRLRGHISAIFVGHLFLVHKRGWFQIS